MAQPQVEVSQEHTRVVEDPQVQPPAVQISNETLASQKLSADSPIQIQSRSQVNLTKEHVKAEREEAEEARLAKELDGSPSEEVSSNIDQTEKSEEPKAEIPDKSKEEKPKFAPEIITASLELEYETAWTKQGLFNDSAWSNRQTERVRIVLPERDPLSVLFVFAGPPEECIWTNPSLSWHPLKKRSGAWCRSYANLQAFATQANFDLDRVYMTDAWPYKVWRAGAAPNSEDIDRGRKWIYAVATSLEIRIVVLFHDKLPRCMKSETSHFYGLENDFVWILSRHPSPQSMSRNTQKEDLLSVLKRVKGVEGQVDLMEILQEFQSYRFNGRAPEDVVDLFEDSNEEIATQDLYDRASARNSDLIKSQTSSDSNKVITKDSFQQWLTKNAHDIVNLKEKQWRLTEKGRQIKDGSDVAEIVDTLNNVTIAL